MSNTTISVTWNQIQPAWNDAADNRYKECLKNTTAPCIINEDDHELTRFEYFEQEHNVNVVPPGDGAVTYLLTFNTPQDLTFFTLKWL